MRHNVIHFLLVTLLGHGLLIEFDVRFCEEVVLGLITVLEKDLSVDPISLTRAHKGMFNVASAKLKGRKNCLRLMKNVKRKLKMMKKVIEVKKNAQLMHGW